MSKAGVMWWMEMFALCLWIVVCGPLWLVGWACLRATRWANYAAAWWCTAILALMPNPGGR